MEQQVLYIITGDRSRYNDCRCLAKLRTATRTYTSQEAYKLVKVRPRTLYIEVNGSRLYLLPASCNGLNYVRTAATDTTEDRLLQVPEAHQW